MKNLMTTLFVFAIFSIAGCSNDNDCGECFTPPAPFLFELVDKNSGENLFSNGTFNPDEIKILDSSNNNVEYSFIAENNINLIQINSIGWQTETINYRINISSENIFDLFVDAERLSEDCCSFTNYKEIEISNTEFDLNSDTEIYKILID